PARGTPIATARRGRRGLRVPLCRRRRAAARRARRPSRPPAHPGGRADAPPAAIGAVASELAHAARRPASRTVRRTRRPRGGALVAALATLAFSAALAAALADLARIELRLTSQRRQAARLLAALDGCLADAVADLPAGWEFTPLLHGPDAIPGTADDGALSAPAGCSARARAAPGAAAPARAVVRVDARIGAGRRTLDAVVRRTA